MKYIIIDGVIPIVFSEAQLHTEFKLFGEITSAGKCRFVLDDGTVKARCFGNSIGLKIKSNPEHDEKVINRNLLDM